MFWFRVWRSAIADHGWRILERILPSSAMRRECTCCGWKGLQFRDIVFGEYSRHRSRCPQCSSLERHRALALYYPRFISELPCKPDRIIHFAPEACLSPIVSAMCARYERSSFDGQDSELRLDLTRLDLPQASCDILLMNQVLDCMHNDRAAIAEMFRVLREGGAVIATAGLKTGSTIEFPMRSTGQTRVYGLDDISERFAPFSVSLANHVKEIPKTLQDRYGINDEMRLIVLRKEREASA